MLRRAGLEVVTASTEANAVMALTGTDSASAALVDEAMRQVCRAVREQQPANRPHLIMLGRLPVDEALDLGADDVVARSAPVEVLLRHLRVARRTSALQQSMLARSQRLVSAALNVERAVAADDWTQALIKQLRSLPVHGPPDRLSLTRIEPSESTATEVIVEHHSVPAEVRRVLRGALTSAGTVLLDTKLVVVPSTPSTASSAHVQLWLTRHTLRVSTRAFDELNAGDVLLEPVVAAALGPVLTAGTCLTRALISRARSLGASGSVQVTRLQGQPTYAK